MEIFFYINLASSALLIAANIYLLLAFFNMLKK